MNENLMRICKECNKSIFYKNVESYRHSCKKYSTVSCISCNRRRTSPWKNKRGKDIPWYGSKSSEHTKQILREKFSGINNPNYGKPLSEKLKKSFNHKGEHLSDTHKENISKANKGKNCYWYNKHRSIDTIEKIKQKIYDKFKNLGYTGKYNKRACDFMDNKENQWKYKFKHALNGGEVTFKRYAVDGYDEENKIIFEYDEPLHEKLGKKRRDLIRTKQLIELSGCKILRYSEKYDKIYWSYPDKSELFI